METVETDLEVWTKGICGKKAPKCSPDSSVGFSYSNLRDMPHKMLFFHLGMEVQWEKIAC